MILLVYFFINIFEYIGKMNAETTTKREKEEQIAHNISDITDTQVAVEI